MVNSFHGTDPYIWRTDLAEGFSMSKPDLSFDPFNLSEFKSDYKPRLSAQEKLTRAMLLMCDAITLIQAARQEMDRELAKREINRT